MTNDDTATVTLATSFGNINVNVDPNDAMDELEQMDSDAEGWDVTFVKTGLADGLKHPVIIGIVVRVPNSSPMNAVSKAQESLEVMHIEGMIYDEHCDKLRILVTEPDMLGLE